MAEGFPRKRRDQSGKLPGWPRPQTSITKSMGLNPVRMALLAAMALIGVFGGYFLGKEVMPASRTEPADEKPISRAENAPLPTSYEESLPRDIVIEKDGVLKRIALPEPDVEIDLGNGQFAPAQTEIAEIKEPTPDESALSDEAEAPKRQEKAEPVITDSAKELASLPPQSTDFSMPAKIGELQKSEGESLPRWQRYALPVTLDAKPKIVIVIDDLGLDKRRARKMIDLPGPMTLAFMSYAEDLERQTTKAKSKGHEIMMHVPMEPRSANINPGPNVLLSGMPSDELIKNIEWNLDQIEGYVGINNHMGSRFTADKEGMQTVISALKERGLLFLDSVTSGRSVAHEVAKDSGIPFAVRNVFLDHEDNLDAINRQLRATEHVAKRTGVAVAIGHPRDKTIEALRAWLPGLAERGFQLVPISAVVRGHPKPAL